MNLQLSDSWFIRLFMVGAEDIPDIALSLSRQLIACKRLHIHFRASRTIQKPNQKYSMGETPNPLTPSQTITWGKPKAVKVQHAHLGKFSFSSIGNSAAVLLEDVKAEANGDKEGLHAASAVALQLPVTADLKKGFVGFLVQVRGTADVSAGGRVSLMVSVNAHAEVAKLNIEEGTAANVQILHEQFAVQQRGAAEANPNVPPLEPLLITVMLVAKRTTMKDVAMLTVDSRIQLRFV